LLEELVLEQTGLQLPDSLDTDQQDCLSTSLRR
jgi:hypothetical protein